MKGNIIEVDYAETNNLNKGHFIKKYFIQDENGNIKGMGSASGINAPTWTPKKPDDERFIGQPGEIKETIQRNGERFLTKIGNNGYAVKERHCGNHGYPDKHTNPHDHKIDWENNHPNLSSPINHPDEIPEFKTYRGDDMKTEYLGNNSFQSVDDFKYALLYGKEIVFKWNKSEYGIFYNTQNGDEFSICKSGSTDEHIVNRIEDVLDYMLQGRKLKDIITQVDVCLRNI